MNDHRDALPMFLGVFFGVIAAVAVLALGGFLTKSLKPALVPGTPKLTDEITSAEIAARFKPLKDKTPDNGALEIPASL